MGSNACVFDSKSLEKPRKTTRNAPQKCLFTLFKILSLFLTALYSISTAPIAPDPSEIERRITEAADAARAEGEAGLEDLLVCLGEVKSAFTRGTAPFYPSFVLTITTLYPRIILQEERKVEVLSAKLAELGVDAEALFAASTSDEKKTNSGDDLT